MQVEQQQAISQEKAKKAMKLKVVAKCIGQCVDANGKYKHDYLHCKQCKVVPQPCFINNCPCGGVGKFIPTADNSNYSHQMPDENKSIRIHTGRIKQALARLNYLNDQAGIKKLSKTVKEATKAENADENTDKNANVTLNKRARSDDSNYKMVEPESKRANHNEVYSGDSSDEWMGLLEEILDKDNMIQQVKYQE
jgi:hypothetical protein